MKRIHSFNVRADYNQFYIQDEQHSDTSIHEWNEEEVNNLFSLQKYSIGIGTYRSGTVPVELIVESSTVKKETTGWDKVNEGEIEVPSGSLLIRGPMDYLPEAPRIHIGSKSCKMVVCYFGSDTISDDGLKGEDFYRIIIFTN